MNYEAGRDGYAGTAAYTQRTEFPSFQRFDARP